MNAADEPNLEQWVDGQWDAYTPDQLLDVLLAQPVGASGQGLSKAEQVVLVQLARVWDRVAALTCGPSTRGREVAAKVLGGYLPESYRRFRPTECLDLLRSMLPAETEPAVLVSLVYGFSVLCDYDNAAQLAEFLLRVVPFTEHQDEDVRYAVAMVLGSVRSDLATGCLVRLSNDPDDRVREMGTWSLGVVSRRDTPELRAALVERLNDLPLIRDEAVYGLARRGDPRAIPRLLESLIHGYEPEEGWCNPFEALEEVCTQWAQGDGTPDRAWLIVLERILEDEGGNDALISAAIARCRLAAP